MALINTINIGGYAFNAYLSAQAVDATGDATLFTLPCDSTNINVGSCYSTGTYTYTVPVTGNYLLFSSISLSGLTSSHTLGTVLLYVNGSASLTFSYQNAYATAAGGTDLILSGSLIAPLTAADALTFRLRVDGGSKVVDVNAASYIAALQIM